ncbi:chromosome partitioning protein ParB [Enterobacter ludwigii]|uniref:chromosome partitioning protein ParB n=1 Tax=Enterobacter ludwigii TaxID=299767 RepID=UPI003F71765C
MANSFKRMTTSGVIKRLHHGMFISIDDIHIQSGFNRRDDDEATQRANDELFEYLMTGGTVPPLEVYERDEGGVWIVEGHRRYSCYLRCREAGKPVNQIHIIPFRGNDIERKARVMTSNRQVPLSDMAKARVIRDLSAFNLTTQEIARYVHLSVPTVEKLMMLGMANHDVQQAVTSGDVALSAAVERVKEFGEKAGEVLEQDKAAAAAAGKKKVTRSFIAPEISVKKARRLVELVALADISEEGSIKLDGLPLAEVLEIIEEHNSIAAQRSKGVQS